MVSYVPSFRMGAQASMLIQTVFVGSRRPEYWSRKAITPRFGASWGGGD
jgi:hypothetical protein